MTKKKDTNKFGFCINEQRNVKERVMDALRVSNVHDVIHILLAEYVFEPNDDILRDNVEKYLSEIYKDIYLVRCSDLENTQETINNGQLIIRFVGFDEDFIVTVEMQTHIPSQSPFNFDLFLKNDRNSI